MHNVSYDPKKIYVRISGEGGVKKDISRANMLPLGCLNCLPYNNTLSSTMLLQFFHPLSIGVYDFLSDFEKMVYFLNYRLELIRIN